VRRRLITVLLIVVMGYGVYASWRSDWFDRVSSATARANPPVPADPPAPGSTSAKSAGDTITVAELSGAAPATLLLDGRRAGACFGNEIHRTAAGITVPNVETPGTCESHRLFAMAVDHGLLRVDPSFTDSGGDAVTVKMSPIVRVPVTVWIAHGPVSDAEVDVKNANVLLNTMQCGVALEPVSFLERTNAPGVSSLAALADCDDVPALKSTVGFTPGQLNVYYIQQIDHPDAPHGIACRADGVDVVLVASGAFLETLAHEIGHTFTLGHSNGLAVPFNNLMLDGAPERDTLTTGQCIRANLNPFSSIALGAPARPASAGCAEKLADPICPALVFDVNSQQ
jgi:hypothetical protein